MWSTQEFEADKIYYELCYRKAYSYNNIGVILPNVGVFIPRLGGGISGGSGGDGNKPAWSFTSKNDFYPLEGLEHHHKIGEIITDLIWNQMGSALALIDQRGKISIWIMNNFVNRWKCICDVNLRESVIIFLWLDCVRMYSRTTETRYKRGNFKGPRNQFGELSFITVTTDGKVSVWYQKGKKQFSKFSTELRYNNSRISHADIIINNDGNYILTTYSPEHYPKVIIFHEIKVDMLKLQVNCRPIAITEFVTSPNGTLLLCKRYSGNLDCLDMADLNWASFQSNIDVMDCVWVMSACANKLTLCILNNMDHTDLENIIKKLSSTLKKDFLEQILEETFTNISGVFPNGFETSTSSDFLIRLFGLQLSLLKSCERDYITYFNILSVLHLRSLEIIFKNCYTFDKTFVMDSLQSLVSLTEWILDFFVYIIRNIYLLYATYKQGRVLASEKSHIVLLYHTISRSALKNLLSFVEKFKDYISQLAINNPKDSVIQEMNKTLEYSFERWPLKLDLMNSFMNESSTVIEKTMQVLPTSLQGTLKEIEQIYKTNFHSVNKVKLYSYDTRWVESESVDIILKSRNLMDRVCIRDVVQGTTQWAKSYARSCVCGGLWIDISHFGNDSIFSTGGIGGIGSIGGIGGPSTSL
ncbi:7368_t:CDS:10 [Diversispora eburnea]|uniref:Mediator of RNA polymerase II transcription subunit 16 n=1 Tax=Diversispora eburnea TaxID=1213867 RepID=A0A9N8ZTR9_9GLOM|nr:7368_t:CDS:10 [Diversispora eburnea]